MTGITAQQMQAIESVRAWHASGAPGQLYRLFGYAGTGKTTLARTIVDALGVPARYAAYTGKAAHVLRGKGCDPVSTVHSLIYLPRAQAQQRLADLRAERERVKGETKPDPHELARLDRAIRAEEDRLSSPSFTLRCAHESALTGAGICVIDEASMINADTVRDLTSFGVPLLCLGDPAQLPPVDGAGALIDGVPDTLLTEIHRSALDSPVTRIATAVRTAVPGTRGYGVTGQDGDSGRVRDMTGQDLAGYDQVLAGTNVTRWQAIHALRAARGHSGRPRTGDRVIILANSGEADVYNGQQFTLRSVSRTGDRYETVATDDTGATRELDLWTWGFTGPDGERRARLAGRGQIAAATYADCITVHKAQGSQWPSVAVLDESDVFSRMARGTAAQRYQAGQRWLYTAVTRASDRVTLAGTGTVRDS